LVVPSIPVPVKKVLLLPEPAEMEAVGTPVLTLVNANFAEAVEVLPISKSCVDILSKIEPFACSNGDPPFTTGRMPVTSIEARLIAEDERIPVEET